MTWEQDARKSMEAVDKGIEGEIVDIVETTAGEIFGEENLMNQEPDRPFINVFVVTQTDEDFSQPFSLPKGPRSWRNRNFKLGRFKRTYGDLPEEGMIVDVEINKDGFLRIRLD